MRVMLKLPSYLLEEIHADLSRPHPYAAERVGFIACRLAATATGACILGQTYRPLADAHYEDDPSVGAMMNAHAIRNALEYAYNHRVAMFHVHRHEHHGPPRFSLVDEEEAARFVPDFWKVAPSLIHGAIVLSRDRMHGKWWSPRTRTARSMDEYVTVGTRITSHLEIPR